MAPANEGRRRLGAALRRAVVKVMTVADPPDFEQPWQTRGVETATGSGVIVSTPKGPRVLTNAHVIEHGVFIEVRRFGRVDKFVAQAEAIGFDCDLALLRVEDDIFFQRTVPIAFGTLPELADRVTVLGFPVGGERLSITEGVVSRVEMSAYAQSLRSLLSLQIDAAINAGNSGGPVIKDGKIVGIAFQALEEAENIGYVIAVDVVRHFLKDVEDGRFDGFPDLGVVIQTLESDAHRRALGLPEDRTGVLVNQVVFEGSAWRVLRRGDVILAVGGWIVANDASVPFRRKTGIGMDYVPASHHVGDEMPVLVWREGTEIELIVKLKPPRYLVPELRRDVKPGYLIYGGLLFAPLTGDYLKTWGEDWYETAPGHLLALYENGVRRSSRRDVVVLQKVLAHEVNRGYHDLENLVITRVQGQRIKCLCDVLDILGETKEPFVRFGAEDGQEIVIDREMAAARSEEILARYGVPSEVSEGLPEGCASGD
jgi:S1-C subfamily serine protease